MSDAIWREKLRPGTGLYKFWCIYKGTGNSTRAMQFEVNATIEKMIAYSIDLGDIEDLEEVSKRLHFDRRNKFTQTGSHILIRSILMYDIIDKETTI